MRVIQDCYDKEVGSEYAQNIQIESAVLLQTSNPDTEVKMSTKYPGSVNRLSPSASLAT